MQSIKGLDESRCLGNQAQHRNVINSISSLSSWQLQTVAKKINKTNRKSPVSVSLI
jgi:hypothetical protein